MIYNKGDKVRRIGGKNSDEIVNGNIYTVASYADGDDIHLVEAGGGWKTYYFELVERYVASSLETEIDNLFSMGYR